MSGAPQRRVLIVDDDPALRAILRRAFVHRGDAVLEAANSDLAIALLRSEQVDLVITDLIMGPGDGFDLLRWLQQRPDSPPVIVCSGRTTFDHAVEALRFGAADFLAKPFDLLALEARIAHVFANRQPPLIAHLAAPALLLDRNGLVHAANQAFADLLGLPSAADLRGHAYATLWPKGWVAPERFVEQRAVQLVFGAEQPQLVEHQRFAVGHLTLEVISDISQISAARTRLAHRETVATINQIVGGLANDLSSPLLVFRETFAHLRRRQAELGLVPEDFELAEAALVQAASLLHHALELYRGYPEAPAISDLNQLLSHTLALFQSGWFRAGLTVEATLAEQLPPIALSPHLTRQLLLLLLTSITNWADGGTLHLSTSRIGQRVEVVGRLIGPLAPEDETMRLAVGRIIAAQLRADLQHETLVDGLLVRLSLPMC